MEPLQSILQLMVSWQLILRITWVEHGGSPKQSLSGKACSSCRQRQKEPSLGGCCQWWEWNGSHQSMIIVAYGHKYILAVDESKLDHWRIWYKNKLMKSINWHLYLFLFCLDVAPGATCQHYCSLGDCSLFPKGLPLSSIHHNMYITCNHFTNRKFVVKMNTVHT